MSTCPEKDIHSLYLDGELAPAYAKKFLYHLESCTKCKAVFENISKLRDTFRKDSEQISRKFTQEELDKSYERLQSRLSFAKVLSYEEKPTFRTSLRSSLKYIITGVAAAAVAAVIIPARLSKKNAQEPLYLEAIQNMAYLDNQIGYSPNPVSLPVRYSGDISPEKMADFFQDSGRSSDSNISTVNFSGHSKPAGYHDAPFGRGPLPPPPPPRMGNPHRASERVPVPMIASQYMSDYEHLFPVDEDSLQTQDDIGTENKNGFSLNLSSPLGNIYLEIGSGN